MSTLEPETVAASESKGPSNFIRDIIIEDLKTNRFNGRVHTRFPPEPNGYLHIGHAKADLPEFRTRRGVRWPMQSSLSTIPTPPRKRPDTSIPFRRMSAGSGFDWEPRLFYASDYFEQLYDWAVQLIKAAKAYVCDLTAEQMREYRGTLTEPGRDSPLRNRTVEENLDLFRAYAEPASSQMAHGLFGPRSIWLRRTSTCEIRSCTVSLHKHHHRTGDKWCIYPMYDYAHGQSDSIERVTHSICTLEFEDHRPLYDWFIEQLGIFPSAAIEFDRLNLTYTLLSKRKLLHACPGRLSSAAGTIRGCPRCRGFGGEATLPKRYVTSAPTSACRRQTGPSQLALLEHFVREDLNKHAARVMGVLRPLRVVIENYPDDLIEEMDAINNPEDASCRFAQSAVFESPLHRAGGFS